MSVQEELGLSDSEWQSLDDDVQNRLLKKQAGLLGYRQVIQTEMLEQDDIDIRKRTEAVQSHILGQDTTKCEDPPMDSSNGTDDVRITVLGDVNSEQSLAAMLQSKQQTTAGGDIKPPPPPKNGASKWLAPLAGVALGAAVAGGAAAYFNQSGDASEYDMIAVPFEPPPQQ